MQSCPMARTVHVLKRQRANWFLIQGDSLFDGPLHLSDQGSAHSAQESSRP